MAYTFIDIFNRSISAVWIILALVLLRPIVKKAPRWISVAFWGLVAFRLLCPFTIESILSLVPSAETVAPGILLNQTPEISSGIPIVDNTINPIITQKFAPSTDTFIAPLQTVLPTIVAVWLIGVALILADGILDYFLLKSKVKTAVLLCDNVYQSEYVPAPFVLGIIKPKIYIPFGVDDEEMRHVIAHEKAHIARKDHLWKFLGFLLRTIHWFNLFMWLAYELFCEDIEFACDARVVKTFDREERADYSQTLLHCSNRTHIMDCPLAFGEGNVKSRVKSVLKYKKPAGWVAVVSIVLGLALAASFLTDPVKPAMGQTDPRRLNNKQLAALKYYSEMCGLDSTKGLNVYMIEIQSGIWEGYLTSHRDTPSFSSVPEISAEKIEEFVDINDLQNILSTYDIATEDVHIIILPWRNPGTGFLSEYFAEIPGETPAEKEKRQAGCVDALQYRLLEEPYDASRLWVIDQITADIDRDGKKEVCYLCHGSLSGPFSFEFFAREAGEKKWEYAAVIITKDSYQDMTLKKDWLGTVYIDVLRQGNPYKGIEDEEQRIDIRITDKLVEFYHNGESIAWE